MHFFSTTHRRIGTANRFADRMKGRRAEVGGNTVTNAHRGRAILSKQAGACSWGKREGARATWRHKPHDDTPPTNANRTVNKGTTPKTHVNALDAEEEEEQEQEQLEPKEADTPPEPEVPLLADISCLFSM
eukprot:scaffold38343_cov26-Tisochrysis_lutea.AAC.8